MSAGLPRTLFIAVSPGELWAALREGDELVELRLFRPGGGGQAGALYLGRIVALRPELPAALVDIGLQRPAFLSAEDAAPRTGLAGLTEGQAIIVQVTKEARVDKATGVTARPRLVGRWLELTPGRPGIAAARGLDAAERARLDAALGEGAGAAGEAEDGFFLRRAAAGIAAAGLVDEAAALRARWRAILARRAAVTPPAALEEGAPPAVTLIAEFAAAPLDAIMIDDRAAFAATRHWLAARQPEWAARLALHSEAEPLFEQAGIASAVAGALAARVPLPGGGALLIAPTAAATLIDVDSGGAPILAANLAAARVAARHIRLRNLAGAIVIDFISMKRRGERARVAEALAAALADDPAGVEMLGWTRLGHMELVRKRRHPALSELLYERDEDGGLVKTALTVALEALRAVAREAAAPGRGLALHVGPAVAAALTDGPAREARRSLEARLGQALAIIAEPGRAPATFDIRRR